MQLESHSNSTSILGTNRKQGGARKPIGKKFAESLSRQQLGGISPKAPRIRHPKIPPLNGAVRGRRVPAKRSNQETECPINKQYPPLTGWHVGGGITDEKRCGQKLSPRFRNEWTKNFQHQLSDQHKKKTDYQITSRNTY
ncbi:hypothetical protein TNCV_4801221 [Trichonephila clavipes]|nr:hypothetical protein TNCV_4801221 [Trichonephila clavipes]